jgi:hypothetical protein
MDLILTIISELVTTLVGYKPELVATTYPYRYHVHTHYIHSVVVQDFISTLVICLKFVFIEMLDKLITYIVCLYKTLYQVLPVV